MNYRRNTDAGLREALRIYGSVPTRENYLHLAQTALRHGTCASQLLGPAREQQLLQDVQPNQAGFQLL